MYDVGMVLCGDRRTDLLGIADVLLAHCCSFRAQCDVAVFSTCSQLARIALHSTAHPTHLRLKNLHDVYYALPQQAHILAHMRRCYARVTDVSISQPHWFPNSISQYMVASGNRPRVHLVDIAILGREDGLGDDVRPIMPQVVSVGAHLTMGGGRQVYYSGDIMLPTALESYTTNSVFTSIEWRQLLAHCPSLKSIGMGVDLHLLPDLVTTIGRFSEVHISGTVGFRGRELAALGGALTNCRRLSQTLDKDTIKLLGVWHYAPSVEHVELHFGGKHGLIGTVPLTYISDLLKTKLQVKSNVLTSFALVDFPVTTLVLRVLVHLFAAKGATLQTLAFRKCTIDDNVKWAECKAFTNLQRIELRECADTSRRYITHDPVRARSMFAGALPASAALYIS